MFPYPFLEAAYMAKMCGGTAPAPEPAPLSLEGIKKLRTLATLTIGDIVFYLKEPSIFTNCSYCEYSNQRWSTTFPRYASYTVNDRFATVSVRSEINSDTAIWKDDDPSEIPYMSAEWTNYIINSADTRYLNQNKFGNISISYTGTKITKEYGTPTSTWTYTVAHQINPTELTFTDLSDREYLDLVAKYNNAIATYEPILEILSKEG